MVWGGVVYVALEEVVSLLLVVRDVQVVETVPVGCSSNGRQTWPVSGSWRQLLASTDIRRALSDGKIKLKPRS